MSLNLPSIGQPAPNFTAVNQHGELVSLNDFLGSKVILYFYPKAMTPGCTVQAQGIRDHKEAFTAANTVVLGISPDAPARLQKFIERDQLNFDLLSDEDHQIAERYGVWGLKKFMGREYDGIHRITFIINEQGVLENILDKVKTKSHHQDVLDLLNNES